MNKDHSASSVNSLDGVKKHVIDARIAKVNEYIKKYKSTLLDVNARVGLIEWDLELSPYKIRYDKLAIEIDSAINRIMKITNPDELQYTSYTFTNLAKLGFGDNMWGGISGEFLKFINSMNIEIQFLGKLITNSVNESNIITDSSTDDHSSSTKFYGLTSMAYDEDIYRELLLRLSETGDTVHVPAKISNLMRNSLQYIPEYDLFFYELDFAGNFSIAVNFTPLFFFSFRNSNSIKRLIEDYNRFKVTQYVPKYISCMPVAGRLDYNHVRTPNIDPASIVMKDDINEILNVFTEFFDETNSSDFFRRYNIRRRRGLLLTGPPGTGKTTLLKYLFSRVGNLMLENIPLRADITIINLQVNEFLTSETLKQVFSVETTKLFLVIEDMDSIPHALKSVFLNLLDGIETEDIDTTELFIIGTTNHPDKIDPALLNRAGRFDRVYRFDLPTPEERRRYFETKEIETLIDTMTLDQLVSETKDFSMANLGEVFMMIALAYDRNVDIDISAILAPIKKTMKDQQKGFSSEHAGARVGFSN